MDDQLYPGANIALLPISRAYGKRAVETLWAATGGGVVLAHAMPFVEFPSGGGFALIGLILLPPGGCQDLFDRKSFSVLENIPIQLTTISDFSEE